MFLTLLKGGIAWLSSNAVDQFRRRPSDLFFGFIGATLLTYFCVGSESFFATLLEIVIALVLMCGVWWLMNKVGDLAEHSVYRLPDDEKTREAEKLVEAMVDAALD